MTRRAVILGGGGHARVIIDILSDQPDIYIVGFTSQTGEPATLLGYPCVGTDRALEALLQHGECSAFVAIGDNQQRAYLAKAIRDLGFGLINAVSRTAIISRHAEIGLNVAVMPGAVINAGVRIEDGVIINSNASVDHDCAVGKYAHIAPGVTLAGNVQIGEGAFLGAGSTVIPDVTVGRATVVGAGAVVTTNLPDGVVAVGVPARVIRSTKGKDA